MQILNVLSSEWYWFVAACVFIHGILNHNFGVEKFLRFTWYECYIGSILGSALVGATWPVYLVIYLWEALRKKAKSK